MKNGIVIADSGPIISLACINKLSLLDLLFDKVAIAEAVWIELTADASKPFFSSIVEYFTDKVVKITGFNDLTFVMDFGESESVILYKELAANFLLIDDKKARLIAENFNINCIGTIGLLDFAKKKGYVTALKPLFQTFLKHKRFYGTDLMNLVLLKNNETELP
ncbi:MAG TPA: DUF3368 domain-containing protein [Bacteroidales bacterium]|nr:DUF3368 domain-containing protein [Bacteroidales bacterium]